MEKINKRNVTAIGLFIILFVLTLWGIRAYRRYQAVRPFDQELWLAGDPYDRASMVRDLLGVPSATSRLDLQKVRLTEKSILFSMPNYCHNQKILSNPTASFPNRYPKTSLAFH